jgi:hypothetical protein
MGIMEILIEELVANWRIVDYNVLAVQIKMRFYTQKEWDEAGGILEMMIQLAMSTMPTEKNAKDLKIAYTSLRKAQDALIRAGVYSADFDATLLHY